jgi:aerobic-type carbon monoxide dehydrogenase small subunit (CoxS/CutS family)
MDTDTDTNFAVVELTVNGIGHRVGVEPRRLLVDLLREDLGLTGTNVGCGQGVCGSCTVLVDGANARA